MKISKGMRWYIVRCSCEVERTVRLTLMSFAISKKSNNR